MVVVSVEPEGQPADDHHQSGGNVHLGDVEAHGAGEEELQLQAAVVARGEGVPRGGAAVAEQAKLRQVDVRVKLHWRTRVALRPRVENVLL